MSEKKTVTIIGKDVPLGGVGAKPRRKLRPVFAVLAAAAALIAITFGIISIHNQDEKALLKLSAKQSANAENPGKKASKVMSAFELTDENGNSFATEGDIVSAEQVSYNNNQGILITLNESGKGKLSSATAAASASGKPIKMFLDGKLVLSAEVPAQIKDGELVAYFSAPETASDACRRINELLKKQ